MARFSFYTVTFVDSFGQEQVSRTLSTLHAARKWARHITYGTNVRIMRGGPGGMQVQ